MSEELPLITICMPTYNHEAYLEESIDSILNQDYKNIQIIISDDCSTDNSREILLAYQKKYPQKIYVQIHPANLGAVENVQSIYPLIKGEFVCWFSGDDIFLPNKLSKQIACMLENNQCVLSYHDVMVANSSGRLLYNYNDDAYGIKVHSNNITQNLLSNRCFICGNSIMINRKLAQGISHNRNIGICNDWLLTIELSLIGNFIYIPEALTTYRRHEQSLSKQVNVVYEETVFNYILQEYPRFKADVYKGLAQLYSMYFFKYLLKRDFKMTISCLKKLFFVIAFYPKNFINVIYKIGSEIYKRVRIYTKTGSIFR